MWVSCLLELLLDGFDFFDELMHDPIMRLYLLGVSI